MAEQHTEDRHYQDAPALQMIETDPVKLAYAEAGGLEPEVNVDTLEIDDKINLYMSLRRRQKAVETDADALKSLANEIEPDIIEHMGDTQTSKITRRGLTLYLHTDYWPALDTGEDAGPARDRSAIKSELIARLKSDPETASMVAENYNTNTLRSWLMHEHADDMGVPRVPERLADILKMAPKTKAKVTASRR